METQMRKKALLTRDASRVRDASRKRAWRKARASQVLQVLQKVSLILSIPASPLLRTTPSSWAEGEFSFMT